ncbi:oxygenase MpaB family protein [Stenotrophomonas sp. SI-NJAU-1]|uniref:oxygenase MpaB family protein n=1 Tax=Stenotrophomonas sp. SI-NJAU-1 TaxID=2886359 RepID=UPI001E4FE6B2|nr:oxygenase MpaB family protein [Stenotrophomonas sp. SI-NJAU-1]UEX18692.1 oxygenase MpaB family protein [Stenotrophomonas sp. SI-NJAU-1]
MPPLLHRLSRPVTAPIRRWVLDAFPRGQSGIDYDHPLGDPGWFGPDSVTWRMHAELPSMLAGGLCALMLQTLHPRALAGVYDHSNFRQDLVGRLRRTTAFVAGTSYAPAREVEALVAKVRHIHAQIRGHTAQGEPYAADDPHLLTWVHVTEAYGFLQGYRRYGREVPAAIADRYYDEYRCVAEALGAVDVPRSAAEVDAYFCARQPELVVDERSREVLQVLSAVRLPVPVPGLSREIFLGAGAALLPDWAEGMLERSTRQRAQAAASAKLMQGMAPLFRRALPDGLASRACARVGVPVESLREWPALPR